MLFQRCVPAGLQYLLSFFFFFYFLGGGGGGRGGRGGGGQTRAAFDQVVHISGIHINCQQTIQDQKVQMYKI